MAVKNQRMVTAYSQVKYTFHLSHLHFVTYLQIISALTDQLHTLATAIETSAINFIQDHIDMREYLCNALLDNTDLQQSFMDEKIEGPIHKYYERMMKPGEFGDHVMLKVASTVFKRIINVHPIFPNPQMVHPITPMEPIQAIYPNWNLLFYDEDNFHSPHYRSIVINDNHPSNISTTTPQNSTTIQNQSLQQIPNINVSPVPPPFNKDSQPRKELDEYDRMCGNTTHTRADNTLLENQNDIDLSDFVAGENFSH